MIPPPWTIGDMYTMVSVSPFFAIPFIPTVFLPISGFSMAVDLRQTFTVFLFLMYTRSTLNVLDDPPLSFHFDFFSCLSFFFSIHALRSACFSTPMLCAYGRCFYSTLPVLYPRVPIVWLSLFPLAVYPQLYCECNEKEEMSCDTGLIHTHWMLSPWF